MSCLFCATENEFKWQRNCLDIFDGELPNVTQMWLLLVNYVYSNITDYHIWFWFSVWMAHHNNLVFPKTLAFKTLHELEYANKYSNFQYNAVYFSLDCHPWDYVHSCLVCITNLTGLSVWSLFITLLQRLLLNYRQALP